MTLNYWDHSNMFSARDSECISDIHGRLTAYDRGTIYLTAEVYRHGTIFLS